MSQTFDRVAALKKRYEIARKEMQRAQRTLNRATKRWELAHSAYRCAQHQDRREKSDD